MTTPHPLNQAVIAQALHDLRNGQLRRARSMGFGDAELAALKRPDLVSVLLNASVSWCSVTVNPEVVRRLLGQTHDVEREISTVDRMLRLGASTEMVSTFFGLSHQGSGAAARDPGVAQAQGAAPRAERSAGCGTVGQVEARHP